VEEKADFKGFPERPRTLCDKDYISAANHSGKVHGASFNFSPSIFHKEG
jgi:hypothetical protein